MSLSKAFDQVMTVAGQIKVSAQRTKDSSAAGPISATAVIQFSESLANLRVSLVAVAATPGLATYVQEQFPGLDLVASYNAMVAQIDATIAWMQAQFPKAASGELLERKWTAEGRTVSNTFDTATLAPFRAQLDLLIATIN